MIAEYWPPPVAEVDKAGFSGWMEAVAVMSMVCLLRFELRLAVLFAAFATATFSTLVGVVLLIFEPLAVGLAFGAAGAAAMPLSARKLRGALFAGLKARVITPAATAAATTVNLCM
ncbi:hypothetical protein MPL1032_120013 [Mesorhizobium plurifarium]|uniref:Uncharacterized protein n=1 Tax=Mesorhizobium plurifarium TaxID=69974 RepID=A0A0K2VQJ7_MESPL|nr:hypothetical protein MPL1032_120013 [Mesorhizobium plurifarium]